MWLLMKDNQYYIYKCLYNLEKLINPDVSLNINGESFKLISKLTQV
jgi:hypothetical protein